MLTQKWNFHESTEYREKTYAKTVANHALRVAHQASNHDNRFQYQDSFRRSNSALDPIQIML